MPCALRLRALKSEPSEANCARCAFGDSVELKVSAARRDQSPCREVTVDMTAVHGSFLLK